MRIARPDRSDLRIGVDWATRTFCVRDYSETPIRFRVAAGDLIVEGVDMLVTLKDSEKVNASIVITDAKGNPARIDGKPVWAAGEEALLTVQPADDGMSASIAAVGPLGISQVTVTADADLGDGEKTLTGILDIEVVGGEATNVGFATGVPEEA